VHNGLLLGYQYKKCDKKRPKILTAMVYKQLEGIMKDIILLLIILVVWFVVNKYLLPRMGVPT